MTNVKIEAGTLYASQDERLVTGLLVPYGEVGKTNLGRFTVLAGALSIPEDPAQVALHHPHDRENPVGRAVLLAEQADGIHATFRINRTPEGDAALAAITSGTAARLSVEAKNLVIRAGKALAGRIFGAAVVPAGAFPSATLYAADAGELDDDQGEAQDGDTSQDTSQDTTGDTDPTDPDDAAGAPVPTDPTNPDDAGTAGADDDPEDENMGNSTLHAAAHMPGATPPAGNTTPAKPAGPTWAVDSAASLYAAMATNPVKAVQDTTLLAALDQVSPTDAAASQEPQWLGEVYQSKTYTSRYADLLSPGVLTALKAIGWVFDKTPTVGDWTGLTAANSQITSTEATTKAVTVDAKRLAGGGAFDRGYIDLPTPGFFEGYFREATNDVERKIDGKIITHVSTAANHTAVVPGAVPAGVATAAAYIVDGALTVIDAEIGLPSYAIVGRDLYRQLLLTRQDDLLAFLNAALGFEGGELSGFKIRPSSNAAMTGAVAVGAKDATTLYRQPGTPIRVDTVNVSNGSGEGGVFAYYALLQNAAKGLAFVKPAA